MLSVGVDRDDRFAADFSRLRESGIQRTVIAEHVLVRDDSGPVAGFANSAVESVEASSTTIGVPNRFAAATTAASSLTR